MSNRVFWLRKTGKAVGQLRLYLFFSLTTRLYRTSFRWKNWGIEICSNPFEKQTSIIWGKRYFDYGKIHIKLQRGNPFINKEFIVLRTQEKANIN